MTRTRAQDSLVRFLSRWNTYFAERFPPLQHGVLIGAFCFGILTHAAKVSTPSVTPWGISFAVAFLTSFLIILQLRILDEFKDFDEDARWRSYRPVPRGLISLAELRRLWLIAAAVQVAAALVLDSHLLAGLLLIWLYSALMGVEFFIRDWLKAHPLTYMLSHIVIAPMIAAYVAACHWLARGMARPSLVSILATSYFAFCVIEIGRKIRAREDEEVGVETYTVLWGAQRALTAWLAFMIAGSAAAVTAASQTDAAWIVAIPLMFVIAISLLAVADFLLRPRPHSGQRFNQLSALWVLTAFLSLGIGTFS